MDLTVDCARSDWLDVYLGHVATLVAAGARRFLAFGYAPRAVEFFARALDAYPLVGPQAHTGGAVVEAASRVTFTALDRRAGSPNFRGARVDCLQMPAARTQAWDAILVWDEKQATSAFAFGDTLEGARGGAPHFVYAAKRARAALVIAIPKCGTHLVSRVAAELGYDVHVPPRVPPELQPRNKKDAFELPDNACYIPATLKLHAANDESVLRWHNTRDPAVLVNYRDPRDAVCSVVHYLMNEAKEPFTPTAANLVHAAILKTLPTHEARLLHAISDPTFPFHRLFEDNTWMLKHPLVCQARFESLIGTAGGGSDEEQTRAVRAIMRHLGAPGDAAVVASHVFDPTQRTFFKGQIGAWREEFKPEHTRAFEHHHPGLLATYGYEPAAL